MLRAIVGSLASAIHTWWCADAIRISPQAGKLLRARCPCLIRIDGHESVMHTRVEQHDGDHFIVRYQGFVAADETPCELVVSTGEHHGLWTVGHGLTASSKRSSGAWIDLREIVVCPLNGTGKDWSAIPVAGSLD